MEIVETTRIPEPEETGSSGTQVSGAGAIISHVRQSPLEGLPIALAIEGLAATRSKGMGGEVAASLIAGSFAQLSYDLQTSRKELHSTRDELKRANQELSDLKTKTAVLQERVNVHSRERHLKNLSITTGTALIGVGIELYRNNFDKYGFIVGGLGGLLLFLGWFSSSEGAEK